MAHNCGPETYCAAELAALSAIFRSRAIQPALLLATSLLSPAICQASGSFSLPFESTTASGRGFAGLSADTDDVSALASNPAAMAWQPHGSAAVGGNLAAYRTLFSGRARRSGTDDSEVAGGNGGNPGRLDLPLPEFSYVHRLGDELVLGARLNAPYGITLRYDPDWTGRYHAIDTIIRGVEFAPSIAWQVTDQLSVGAAAIYQHFIAEFSNDGDLGSVIQRQVTEQAGADITSPSCALANEPTLPGKYDFRNRFEISQPGFGLQLGLLWRYSNAGRVGLAYRSSIEHQLDGQAFRDRRGWSPDDLRSDPCLATVNAALTLQGRSFEDEVIRPAVLSSSDTGFSAPFAIPDSLSLAVQHQFGSMLASSEMRWTRWDRIDSIPFRFQNNAPSVTEPVRFRNSLRIGLGLDWQLNARWTLRGGIAHEGATVTDQTRTARAPDGARRYITAGASYAFSNNWRIDAAAGYMRSDARPVRDLADASNSGNLLDGSFDALELGFASARLVWTPLN